MNKSVLLLTNESDFALVKIGNTDFSVFIEIENGQPVVRINSDPETVAVVVRAEETRISVEKSDLIWDASSIPISMNRPSYNKRLKVLK